MDRFEFNPLPYRYNELSGLFSEKALKTHHLKHQFTYYKNLVSLVENNQSYKKSNLEDIVKSFVSNKSDSDIKIKNNACGLYNHQIWWDMMTQKSKYKKPNSEINSLLEKNFGSFDEFEEKFLNLSTELFGSGWVWLCCIKNGNLSLCSTEKQNNPLSENTGYPILGIDLWEHAFYLDYLNKKKEYVKKFMKYINWDEVTNKLYESEKSKL